MMQQLQDVGASFHAWVILGLVAYYYSGEGNGGGNSLNRLAGGMSDAVTGGTDPNLSADRSRA